MKAVRTILAGLCIALIAGNVAAITTPTHSWTFDATAGDPANNQGSVFYNNGQFDVGPGGQPVVNLGQIGWGAHQVDLATGAAVRTIRTNDQVQNRAQSLGMPPMGSKGAPIRLGSDVYGVGNDHGGFYKFDAATWSTGSLEGSAPVGPNVFTLTVTENGFLAGGVESAATNGTVFATNFSAGFSGGTGGQDFIRAVTLVDNGATINVGGLAWFNNMIGPNVAERTAYRFRGISHDGNHFYTGSDNGAGDWVIFALDEATGADTEVARFTPTGTDFFLGGTPRLFGVDVYDNQLYVVGADGRLYTAPMTSPTSADVGMLQEFDLQADIEAIPGGESALFGVSVTQGPGGGTERIAVISGQREGENGVRSAFAFTFDQPGGGGGITPEAVTNNGAVTAGLGSSTLTVSALPPAPVTTYANLGDFQAATTSLSLEDFEGPDVSGGPTTWDADLNNAVAAGPFAAGDIAAGITVGFTTENPFGDDFELFEQSAGDNALRSTDLTGMQAFEVDFDPAVDALSILLSTDGQSAEAAISLFGVDDTTSLGDALMVSVPGTGETFFGLTSDELIGRLVITPLIQLTGTRLSIDNIRFGVAADQPGGPGGAGIPEPATGLLAAIGVFAALGRRRNSARMKD